MVNPALNRIRPRRPGEFAFVLAFVVFSAILLTQIGTQTQWINAKSLPAEPRFWPLLSLGGMLAFGLAYIAQLTRRPSSGESRAEFGFWLRSLEYAAWYLAYVVAVPYAGYLLSTVLFCVLLTLRAGYRGRLPLISAFLFGVAVVVFFKSMLNVKMPGGAIYDVLPAAARNFMITHF